MHSPGSGLSALQGILYICHARPLGQWCEFRLQGLMEKYSLGVKRSPEGWYHRVSKDLG